MRGHVERSGAINREGKAMKEHPILFSGPMVRAILEGRKTQTRCVMKPQPELERMRTSNSQGHRWDSRSVEHEIVNGEHYLGIPGASQGPFRCPYGAVGDRLWVRETWRRADGLTVYYKADEPENRGAGWKSSIHMPYRFSRLKLEIADIRVERLQDVGEADAKAEGILFYGDLDPEQDDYKNYEYEDKYGDDWGVVTARESFETLWQSINSTRKGCAWSDNPWVWVIEFSRAKSEGS